VRAHRVLQPDWTQTAPDQTPGPALAPVGGVPQRTYFLELRLKRLTRVIDRNVHWLSTVGDVPTPAGSAYPNLSTYGDLRNLQTPAQST
jgi:exo-1,4-beta-D-glucosaminidase